MKYYSSIFSRFRRYKTLWKLVNGGFQTFNRWLSGGGGSGGDGWGGCRIIRGLFSVQIVVNSIGKFIRRCCLVQKINFRAFNLMKIQRKVSVSIAYLYRVSLALWIKKKTIKKMFTIEKRVEIMKMTKRKKIMVSGWRKKQFFRAYTY